MRAGWTGVADAVAVDMETADTHLPLVASPFVRGPAELTQIHQQLWMVAVAVAFRLVADVDWVHRAPYADAEREDSVVVA